jgi:hypothetical protein
LELPLGIRIGNRKQPAHRTKISRFGRMSRFGSRRQAEQEERCSGTLARSLSLCC